AESLDSGPAHCRAGRKVMEHACVASRRLLGRKNLLLAVGDLINHERLFLRAVHARCAGWHAGQRNAFDLRALAQELADRTDRYVAFNHVTAEQDGVAAFELRRYAVLLLDRG